MEFRKLLTDKNTLILGGKNSKNNEEIVEQVGKGEDVFHTDAVGSPFVNIKGKARRGDARQAAVFCATFSKEWKKNKSEVIVHQFKGRDIYKNKGMKEGTFGVKKFKKIKVKKEEIQEFLERWGK